MTRTADVFIAELGASVKALKAHLSTLDQDNLQGVMDRLPTNVTAGSAEMVILIHLNRELDARRSAIGKVINFPTR